MTSRYAPDAELVSPDGTFKGRTEIGRYDRLGLLAQLGLTATWLAE